MKEHYDEDSFCHFKDWLAESDDELISRELFIKNMDEKVKKLIEKAFLDGFSYGRERRNQENWNLWNQK